MAKGNYCAPHDRYYGNVVPCELCEEEKRATPAPVSDERLADLIRVAEGREEEGRNLGLHQIARELRRDALVALRELQRLRAGGCPWRKVPESLPTDAELGGERTVVVLHCFEDGSSDIDSPLWSTRLWKPPHMRTPQFWCFLDELPLPPHSPATEGDTCDHDRDPATCGECHGAFGVGA